jgi:hypothetical protein
MFRRIPKEDRYKARAAHLEPSALFAAYELSSSQVSNARKNLAMWESALRRSSPQDDDRSSWQSLAKDARHTLWKTELWQDILEKELLDRNLTWNQ